MSMPVTLPTGAPSFDTATGAKVSDSWVMPPLVFSRPTLIEIGPLVTLTPISPVAGL